MVDNNTAVGKLLAKRARLHISKPLEPPSPPAPKKIHKQTEIPPQFADVNDCLELCSLLLQKVGADVSKTDVSTLDSVLTKEYPPRVAEILVKLASSLDKDGIIDYGSEVTESSDDERENDATVPQLESSLPPRTPSVSDAVVPQLAKPSAQLEKIAPVPAATAYKKETEIAISRIFDLGKVAGVVDPSIDAHDPYYGPSVVTMTGFGELGRFGNQVLQYMFLKCYAAAHNVSEIQVPAWVGAGLFGLSDRPVQRSLPPVVEFRGTLANSTFTTEFIDYVKNSNPGFQVAELNPSILQKNIGFTSEAPVNVDMWGWFQWHSSHFKPFKTLIQDTFDPIPEIRSHFESIFNEKIRYRDGKKHTVVGLHLRLGDYQNIAASSFGFCAPTSWYLDFLAKVWPTLENPLLFVASDDLNAVLRDFGAYSPITADSIGMKMPQSLKHLRAGFFPDWFSLTQCDVLGISNSTFSFSACMMNRQPNAQFFRAHYKDRMTAFEPWNSDPIVHRDMSKAGIAAALETLQVVYNTQGSKGLARNIFYELPYFGIRSAIMKAVLWREAKNKAAIRAL